MQKWEYLTCNTMLQDSGGYRAAVAGMVKTGSLEGIFNELAAEGWELVTCTSSAWNTVPANHPAFDAVGYMAVFRRAVG